MSLLDPLKFVKYFWPQVKLYDKQAEIMYSVIDNDETIVPAGNMLGKDFISALIALYFFCRTKVSRVVTTSVDEGQLEKVLWGELVNFINSSRYPLPLVVNHLDIKKKVGGKLVDKAYLIGRVAKREEGLLGHHLPKLQVNDWVTGHDLPKAGGQVPTTLMIYDESSGIPHEFKTKTDTWAHRTLIIGNPFPCENFFKKGAKEGSIPDPDQPGRYYRNVIRIRAEDSPNVKLALLQQERGLPITNQILLPGLLDYLEYLKRRRTWDPMRQSISLDAEFYEGANVLLFPTDWLNKAQESALALPQNRKAKAIGVDPAEGGDNTSFAAVDELGLLDLVSKKTPNTMDIVSETIAFMRYHNVDPRNVVLDRGGGGKQIADRLRQLGYPVRTVAFGESATPEKKHGTTTLDNVKKNDETRYAYYNRRAEMYGILRNLIDPSNEVNPLTGTRGIFGLPPSIINAKRLDGGASLREQLAVIPLVYDPEGRLKLPPKNKRSADSKEISLTELIGCSPDESDAVVLGTFGLFKKPPLNQAGAAI